MSANMANSTIHHLGVDTWVVSWTQAFGMGKCVVMPPGECLPVKADMVLFAGNIVWSISKRVRGIRVDALYKLTLPLPLPFHHIKVYEVTVITLIRRFLKTMMTITRATSNTTMTMTIAATLPELRADVTFSVTGTSEHQHTDTDHYFNMHRVSLLTQHMTGHYRDGLHSQWFGLY